MAENETVENTEMTEEEKQLVIEADRAFHDKYRELAGVIKNEAHVSVILGDMYRLLMTNSIIETPDEAAASAYKLAAKYDGGRMEGVVPDTDIQYAISPIDSNIILRYNVPEEEPMIIYHAIQTGSFIDANGEVVTEEMNEKLQPYFKHFEEVIRNDLEYILKLDRSRVICTLIPPEESEEVIATDDTATDNV